MKRPAFQFYPADWRKDSALQACSVAARGLWIELMCIMHECEPYGTLSINGKALDSQGIARLVGESPVAVKRLLGELEGAGVFSRTESGAIYSRRMVKDERVRNARADGGKDGAKHGAKGGEFGGLGGRPKGGKKTPLVTPLDGHKKPPPSSSSSSSRGLDMGERTPSSPAGSGTSATLSLVPPDFRPNDAGIARAGSVGISGERLEAEVSAFVDHYLASGETRADWQAQWRKWCLNSTNFRPVDRGAKHGTGTPKAERVCAVCGAESYGTVGSTWYCDDHTRLAINHPELTPEQMRHAG